MVLTTFICYCKLVVYGSHFLGAHFWTSEHHLVARGGSVTAKWLHYCLFVFLFGIYKDSYFFIYIKGAQQFT